MTDRLGLGQKAEEARRRTSARRVPRHCWALEVEGRRGEFPALLVEWRHGAGGWEGRVEVAMGDGETGVVTLSLWLPAGKLRPL